MRRTVLALGLLPLLAACGPTYSPNTYATNAMQQAAKVEQAVVVGVRPVRVSVSGTVGAATGAAAGGVVGAAVPGTDLARALTGISGGLVGGAVGAGIEHAGGDATAFEYILRKRNGDLLSVTQRDKVPLALDERVLVITGPQARVVRDYTVPPTEAAATPQAPAPASPALPPTASAPEPPPDIAPVPPPISPP